MSKQQQEPVIPRYTRLPGEPEGIPDYYERLAKEKSVSNLAKSAAIPTLHEVYQAKRLLEEQQELQHEQEQLVQSQSSPWAGLMLPPNDPLMVEARRKQLNHE